MEKGERFFRDERYADARTAFTNALEKINAPTYASGSIEANLRDKLIETGNRLALINLSEAQAALNRSDFIRAEEHLILVSDLAEDVTIREKAEKLKNTLAESSPISISKDTLHSCTGCTDRSALNSDNNNIQDNILSAQERFELLIQTLPGDLPERYASMGEKFAYGYLLAHEGNEKQGSKIFEELLSVKENDILLYEIALVYFNNGNLVDCERLLLRAIDLNNLNPLCYLGLVHFLMDMGRFHETFPLLHIMIENELLSDQAMVMLGDVHAKTGNDEEAMQSYSKALSSPRIKKVAAERLITLLEKYDRTEEAKYLFNQFMIGCC